MWVGEGYKGFSSLTMCWPGFPVTFRALALLKPPAIGSCWRSLCASAIYYLPSSNPCWLTDWLTDWLTENSCLWPITFHTFLPYLLTRPHYHTSLPDLITIPPYQTSLPDLISIPPYQTSLPDLITRPPYHTSLPYHLTRPPFHTSLSYGLSIYDVHTEGWGVRLRWTLVDMAGGQAPCGNSHRKLKLESTDVILSSSHAKKLVSFLPELRLWTE